MGDRLWPKAGTDVGIPCLRIGVPLDETLLRMGQPHRSPTFVRAPKQESNAG